MRNLFMRLMAGRYGFDTFSRFLSVAGIAAVMFASVFQRRKIGVLFYFAGWALLVCCVARVFSRNITKRAAENQKFLAKCAQIKDSLMGRGAYRIYKCPECKQKIRIPRGKGKIEITCPKCGEKFIRRS